MIIKIADFGLCKIMDAECNDNNNNNKNSGGDYIVGTNGYMAPELLIMHPKYNNLLAMQGKSHLKKNVNINSVF